MEITDSTGRVGVVIEDRGGSLFAVPLGSRELVDAIHPGVGRAKYMTATGWIKQPDGSYRGIWFDTPINAPSVTATVTGDVLARLRRCGEVLYGERWQSALARDLGIGDRRVREWLSGDRRMPTGVWADIASLLRHRSKQALALLRELDA